ncbi:Farnesyltranstransferase [Spironucleus salmonicida]|uniref:Protein farnesyltransferase/geranylgeranyltransferase type-1 subunit alpha n=1 Tax=Spironucleus salmonicida TaxID=348837 RepID=V6LSG0_9EUKA|nr:Farnesyltranstransferase [Spironucleus salmonicida]|eukprot:EST47607.1 Protein prenyltransferase alpha subunit repeat-containing protein [Spironucleus salmonicida]
MTWEDIPKEFIPDIEQDILQVTYSEEYKVQLINLSYAYTYNELSERAFATTQLILSQNPYQYTAYTLRRKILFQRNDQVLLAQEIVKTHNILLVQPKNFQQWHHIHEIIEFTLQHNYYFDPQLEINFTDQVFEMDQKNYHSWDFRIWLVQRCGIQNFIKSELAVTVKLLLLDPLNNSYWSYRAFLFKFSTITITDEFEFYKTIIHKAPSSEPGWNFLVSLFDISIQKNDIDTANKIYDYARENCIGDGPIRAPALFLCVDNVWFRKEDVQHLSDTCNLVAKFDVPRKNYWAFMSKEIFDIVKEKDAI